ncbi:MAG TPA: NAD(P)H-dependent glycerol-3-phosphate dehydrogenase [Bryobacteraceae bacterium]|nr:NAD(P)H-dependent glycerol-3-phosphate dehydrogenase [Bryobacteraceae bacterium]
MSRLTVAGAGSWGTALAAVLSPRYDSVHLWANEPELAARINASHENSLFLPGCPLPDNVTAFGDLDGALEDADVVLGVMPSKYTRAVWSGILPHLRPETRLVSATKGLEGGTLLRASEVIAGVISPRLSNGIAVLSGPTFAREVARGEPAALVISSLDGELAASIQQEFSGPTFRLYTNGDPVGVEIGASLKNVIAIAAGVCAGLGLGSNAVAALITRGLAEISRLAFAMGGQARTLAGLAGLGDLVLTCTGELSRNRSVGMELAKGRGIQEIVSSMKMVAEGVDTTPAALELATRYSVSMPITSQMNRILRGECSPQSALRELMERSLKDE